jgi:hypothetical protein
MPMRGVRQMLNKSISLPVPRTRLHERRRWDRNYPMPVGHDNLAYRQLVIVVLAAAVLYSVAIILGLGVPSLGSYSVSPSTSGAVVMDLALLSLALLHFHFVQRPYAVPDVHQIRRSPARRNYDRLLVSALLLAFFFVWQPLPDLVWALGAPWPVLLLHTGGYVGWLSLLVSAALLEVPSFLRMALRTGAVRSVGFATRAARSGIVCGLLLVEWCAAQMDLGHLLFAGAVTAYLCTTLFLYRRSVNTASRCPNAMNKGLQPLQE